MNYTGTITVKIKPKLLNHTPVGDGFFDITRRISFSEGGADSSFTFTESSDGSLGEAKFAMFTMFPLSITDWSSYSGATVDDKVQNALNDHTFDFEIPPRTEVQIYEDATLLFGGVVMEVARVRAGGTITTNVTCSDYTALLDEIVIDRYKAPFETYDYQLIRGGYETSADKNGVRITKIINGSSGGGSPTRVITATLEDAHDLIVGQKVNIDQTSNYNGAWTVASILSLISYTATNSSTYAGPVSVTNAARAGSTATITVGTHAFIVGDTVEVALATGPTGYAALNGTYKITSVVANTSITYTTTTSGTVTSGAATGTVKIPDEKSGRSTPWTISFFEDVNKTDPYSGVSIAHGINYDSTTSTTGYVVTGSSDWRFSPINYVPDAQFPEKLGAKIFLPLSEGKSDVTRASADPRSLDSDQRLRLYRLDNEIKEMYVLTSIGAYDAASNYLDITTISDHNFESGQILALGNVDYSRVGDYSAGFRANKQSETVLRIETNVDPGLSLRSAAITGATSDGTFATYTCNNTFLIGDPIAISGITASGGSTGSFNVSFTIIEDSTPTTFKVRNSTDRTYTSGGTAYASFVALNRVQSVGAFEKRLKLISGQRLDTITTLYYDSATSYFNVGDVIHVNGSTTYDGRFTVTEVGSAPGNSGVPIRIGAISRTNNVGQVLLTDKALSISRDASAHAFDRGEVVDVVLPSPYASFSGTAKIITGVGAPGSNLTASNIYYASTGSNQKYTNLTKAQKLASSITFAEKTLSYVKFIDSRADTANSPISVSAGAYISIPYHSWDAVSGGSRTAATPSTSFITMPNDSIDYMGGRQSVDFEASEFQGIGTSKYAEIAYVSRASNVVTIRTKSPHAFIEGETVTIAASAPYTSLNGSYGISDATVGTFTFSLAGSNITEVAATGSATSVGTGFYAAGRKMSCICVVKLESLPSAGEYRTVWHHGSITTGQRRELQINDAGAICFMTINNAGSTQRFTTTLLLTVGETAIIFVSYNPGALHMYPAESGSETFAGSGLLTIQKNDETPQTQTVSTIAVTNLGNFTVGHGYTNAGVATSFFDGLIGNIYVLDRVLRNTERDQMVSWMAHYFTISDLLSEDNAYRYLADHPGKIEVNRAKEPFNAMTLRQAMDYICKKTGSQYWIDASKNLHYQRRDVKNLVENATYEDKFGNSSSNEWNFGGSFVLSNRSSGPYGYGYAATCAGSTESIARSQYFTVAANEVYFASALMKTSDSAKSRLKIRFYDVSNAQVGAEKTIGSGLSLNNSWQKMWGMVKVPGTAGIVKAALIFHHTSHSSSYTDFYADPKVVKITSEYGFADYGIAPGASVEMLFDPDLNAILPMKTYESPENISQGGTQANRLYLYGKATTVDQSNSVITPYVQSGQVIRYTFDYVQGVWDTHGKIVEASKTDTAPESVEDAVLSASSFWAENGQSIESYEFSHSNNASAGRLTVGSIIPYLWSEVGIVEPLVVKSQTVTIIGGEIYYSVQLAGEPAFQKNAIILVQKEYLTENLGTGKIKFMAPTKLRNLVVQTVDNDGKITTIDQNVQLSWSIDTTNPSNKSITGYEIERRRQELKKTSFSKTNMKAGVTVLTRTAAVAGGISVVSLTFASSTGIDVGAYIQIKGGQIGKQTTRGPKNPSLAGSHEVISVTNSGKTIKFNQYASATNGITELKAKQTKDIPSIVVSWYENVAKTAETWQPLVTTRSQTYTDDGDTDTAEVKGPGLGIKYRYQYRVRAVSADLATGVKLSGPWSYVPPGYINASAQSGWIYITDSLMLSGVVEPIIGDE
jgi:hypothetical protein